jgi:hypothetical protein
MAEMLASGVHYTIHSVGKSGKRALRFAEDAATELERVRQAYRSNLHVKDDDYPIEAARKCMVAKGGLMFLLFITTSAFVALVEPFLVSYGARTFNSQVGLLAAGTFLFVVNLVYTYQYFGESYNGEEISFFNCGCECKAPQKSVQQPVQRDEAGACFSDSSDGKQGGVAMLPFICGGHSSEESKKNDKLWKKYSLLSLFDAATILELVFLVWGWATIFTNLGLASLRCFRIIRFVWYFHLFVLPDENPNSWVDPAYLVVLTKVYLEKIAGEFATKRSKGGVVVLALYFFSIYLFAVVFSIDKGYLVTPEGQTCDTIKDCFFTLLRLSFYDGQGFDYMATLASDGQPGSDGYTVLLMLFTIGTGILLLNGLIGIFGSAFTTDSDGDGEDDVKTQLKVLLSEVRAIKTKLNM